MHAGAAGTLIDVYLTLMPLKPWPAFTAVVTLIVLTDGVVEAGFRVARRLRRLTVSASEGCVRAVAAVLIHSIYTQSPILAWLLLALVNVDFALVSLETGQAGAIEATSIVMATAAIETRL